MVSQPQSSPLLTNEQEEFAAYFAYLAEQARTNYLAFYSLMSLRPDEPKVVGAFQERLAGMVQGVVDGTASKRQMTSAPPQHTKSDVLVRTKIPWLMGVKPRIQIGLAAYDFALVEELSLAARAIVEHPWYSLVFPEAGGLSDRICRIVNWGTQQGSRLRAVSFGRKLVGRRVDWFIGDDIYTGRAQVEQKKQRAKIRQWFFSDCITRLSPDAVVWLLGTRWHQEDLQGYLNSDDYRKEITATGQTDELFTKTNFPAIAEPTDDEPDPMGRQAGEPLCPEMGRTIQFLQSKKAILPALEWESQFKGKPKSVEEAQIDVSRFRYIDSMAEVPEGGVFARGWDLAAKAKQIHDWSVGAKCAWDESTNTFYILDIWRRRMPWIRLKKRIIMLTKAEADTTIRPVFKIGVEAVAGFEHSYQDIKYGLRGKVRVEARNPRGKDKLTRAMPWFNRVEACQVVMLRAPWNKDFIAELEVFPTGDYDDQIDAVTIAHEVLTRRLDIKHA